MPARVVHVSIDEELLRRIDADGEARRKGRSAFFRAAASFYLAAKERVETDEGTSKVYSDRADEMFDEIASLIEVQLWPVK